MAKQIGQNQPTSNLRTKYSTHNLRGMLEHLFSASVQNILRFTKPKFELRAPLSADADSRKPLKIGDSVK